MTSLEVSLPVYMRVGDTPEQHLGTVTMPLRGGHAELVGLRTELAALYRALADALEGPLQDEEVPDAAA